MTVQPMIESGMAFGPFPDGDSFYIEKSEIYAAIQDGVKMAEFLLLRRKKDSHPVMWIVEAKQSSPRPETQPNYDAFLGEIRDKLLNAFSLGWAACLDRHVDAKTELSPSYLSLDLSKTDVKFILVIRGHREEWLQPLQDDLSRIMRPTVKTWAFSPMAVAVINDTMAYESGLIYREESHEYS